MSVSLLAGAAIAAALACLYEAFVSMDDARAAFWFGFSFGLLASLGVFL